MEDELEKQPGRVDDGYPEDDGVELVLRLVDFLIVVPEEHEQRHLMQNQLLAQAHIEVIGFNVPEHGKS